MTSRSTYSRSWTGPASTRGTPAARHASIASCGAFSGTNRPDQTAGPPPSPDLHRVRSRPLRTTTLDRQCDHERRTCSLTATKDDRGPVTASVDSHNGSGGVCRVVIIGARSVAASSSGSSCSPLWCTTSKSPARSPARRVIRSRYWWCSTTVRSDGARPSRAAAGLGAKSAGAQRRTGSRGSESRWAKRVTSCPRAPRPAARAWVIASSPPAKGSATGCSVGPRRQILTDAPGPSGRRGRARPRSRAAAGAVHRRPRPTGVARRGHGALRRRGTPPRSGPRP